MIENPVPWPNGAKCAAAITFDIDTDSFLHLDYGERVPDMVSSTSWLRYDEIAVPRLLKIFREYDLRQTFFYPAWCMEQHPRLVEMILEGGHEIGHHGYLHESPNRLTREDELHWLQRSTETIVRMTGQKPRGYRAPVYNFSRDTADLLAQEGFLYDSSLMTDDVPNLIRTGSGNLIELPTHWAMDDWPHYVHNIELQYMMSIRSPDEAKAVYLSEFDFAYEHGGLWLAIWHPWVSARGPRAQAISQMIRYIMDKGDVWFATLEEIATHINACIADGSYTPRAVDLPYYTGALPDDQRPKQI